MKENKINDIIRQIAVLLATVGVIAVNGLANALPLNGQGTGEISDRFDVYFVPAGYVFGLAVCVPLLCFLATNVLQDAYRLLISLSLTFSFTCCALLVCPFCRPNPSQRELQVGLGRLARAANGERVDKLVICFAEPAQFVQQHATVVAGGVDQERLGARPLLADALAIHQRTRSRPRTQRGLLFAKCVVDVAHVEGDPPVGLRLSGSHVVNQRGLVVSPTVCEVAAKHREHRAVAGACADDQQTGGEQHGLQNMSCHRTTLIARDSARATSDRPRNSL